MKPAQMIEILEAAAGQLAIKVRYEPLPPGGSLSGGGLCRVHGEWQLIVDKKASPSDRVAILVDALAGFDTEAVFLPPKLREVVVARRTALQGNATAAESAAL